MTAASPEAVLSPLEAEMERLRLLELQRTAFHEAGHAVVACLFGRPPLWIRMGSEELAGTALGETNCPGWINIFQPFKNTEESIFQACAYDLGGYLAEMAFCRRTGQLDEESIRRHARRDFRCLDLIFQNLKFDDRGVCLGDGLSSHEWGSPDSDWERRNIERRRWVAEDWQQRRDAALAIVTPATEQLLSENWHRVQTVAAMLLRFGKLSQSQIEAAFNAAGASR